jgi:lipoyl(octanoyl) transferase
MRLRVRRLGRRGYADGCALQESAARSVGDGGPDELLFVEHGAVITLGRGTTPDQLLAFRADLAAAGIAISRTDRGGGATYHGPGQIIGYPIVDLHRRAIGVRTYLRALEASLVRALGSQGVDAFVRTGLTGVWTDDGKVASIGIAVRRGVTRHGFALNISPDLDAFRRIVPCGLPHPVTSLRKLGWDGERAALCDSIADALECSLGAPPAFPQARASGAAGMRLTGGASVASSPERAIFHV